MDGLTAARLGLALADEQERERARERERRLTAPNQPIPPLEDAFRYVVFHTEGGLREGTFETPARAARGWLELTDGYAVDVDALCKTFRADGSQMVAVTHSFASLCEHHLLPFLGSVGVAYIPVERQIGLSKIPRIVDALAHRLQQQERLTVEIADAIERNIEPLGILVRMEAMHSCACHRGVKKHDATMRTQVARGAIFDDARAREEAIDLLR